MHASMWSSSIDVASNTDSNLNAPGEADKTAAFLNSAGAGSWDAVFNDVDDHNAAWWELASCGTPPCVNQYYTHWWDPSNARFPNFTRYLGWVAELHAKTLRPQVVWQVPMGNQYFLTMNNTCGHYQDNVAPYFIAHASDLFAAGLVAVMFGPGNSCQTSYDDAQKDGITNNNGVTTSDSLGGCSACNVHQSSWADDDGGYLRIFVGKYYAGQTPCAGVSASAMPASPQASGSAVQLTATATGCANPLYEFWMLTPGSSTWQAVRGYSAAATFSWSTAGLATGTYRFSIWVRDSTSSGLYGNGLGAYDAFNASTYYSLVPGCASVGVSATPASPAMVGSAVTVSGAAAGCVNPNPSYEFWILYPGSGTWRLAQAYTTSPGYSWSTTGLAPGTYRFSVWARDSSSSASYDAWNAGQYFTLTSGCSSIAVSATAGNPVTIGGRASGCLNPTPVYEFWILYPGSGTWTLAQGYSTSAAYSWPTTGLPRGTYRFSVWVKDSSSSAPYDAWNAGQYWTL
jgi:hypothetical protein